MLSKKKIIIHMGERRYKNGVYDVANIFYPGGVRFCDCGNDCRGAEPNGANPIDARADALFISEKDGKARIGLSCALPDGAAPPEKTYATIDLSSPPDAAASDQTGAEDELSVTETLLPATETLLPATETLLPATETLLPATETLLPVTASAAYRLKMAVYRLLKARFEVVPGTYGVRGVSVAPRADDAPGADGTPGEGDALESCFSLPWGALVGIRPVKLYARLLSCGLDRPEAAAYMKQAFDVSERASGLCMRIAESQACVIGAVDPETDYMLYIGIPFCKTKCAYCSFPSDAHNKAREYANAYVGALLGELDYIAAHMRAAGRELKVVYIGGGTPTALGRRELKRLLDGVALAFSGDMPDEFTVEAGRADSIDRDMLRVIGDSVNRARRVRICINPQTMNQKTLTAIGREHTPGDVANAFRLAREAGFDDINADVIAGLPGEDARDFSATLEALSSLGPDSIAVHTLCVKRSSRINEFGDAYVLPSARETEKMLEAAAAYAAGRRMEPYYLYRQKNTIGNLENIGYARRGHACLYNIHEMADSLDVLAAGAGAVSKFLGPEPGRIDRVFNVKNLLEYINRTDEMINRKRKYLAGTRGNPQKQ